MKKILTTSLTLLFVLILSNLYSQVLDINKLHGLKPRAIGPAGMSGRVTAIDVVRNNPAIIYVGTASGGLWKTTSGGIDWTPIFDTMTVISIGAVKVDPNIPDIVWVGTGEGNPRNSQNSGNGIYKSIDGGKTFQHLGLNDSRNIHRIIIDPRNSDVVYVGVQGSAWGDSKERGVYRTTDGGISWNKILYVNERTGIADLVMDPSNPNKLIAAMWEFRREPHFFKSGGAGSGLYITHNGGKNWKKITHNDGLPKGELGRIGLAISKSNTNIVYALVEAKINALYKSTNGGLTWFKVSDKNIGDRPFYYSEIYVDPTNENRIYNIFTYVTVSEDGGKTFQRLINKIHPDHHAFYIHPDNPNFLIDGNDGGLAISYDKGVTWRFIENLPVAQFYHINVDNDLPYSIYGGLQDNGSWKGPSRVLNYLGISNSDWQEVGFGDGFDVSPDPEDSRFGYAMSQGGNLFRYDSKTGLQVSIRPIHPEGIHLRFNWNAAFAQDPFDKSTIYYGSQFLHRSTDKGNSWENISPDLTTNDTTKQKQLESGGLTPDVTSAENHCTIVSIAPSLIKKGLIWVGTDDGNLQLTTDSGKSWKNLVKNIKGVPAGTWIPQIFASPHNPGEAFVVFDNHRRNDWTPYLFHTTDFGKTWNNLVENKNIPSFCLSVVQDPVKPKLLFLGTETGLYVSIDYGKNWTKWKNDFPSVPTTDLIIHPRENDLVIGTFGRSVYIIDNISPLREVARSNGKNLESKLLLFPIPNTYLFEINSPKGTRFPGHAEFYGENLPFGTMITFVYNSESKEEEKDSSENANDQAPQNENSNKVKVEIFDSDLNKIRTLNVKAKNGLNRIYWNLSRKGVRIPSWEEQVTSKNEPEGPQVKPGKYLVKISYANYQDSNWVTVLQDPRLEISLDEIEIREQEIEKVQNLMELASRTISQLKKAYRNIDLILDKIKTDENFSDLRKTLNEEKNNIKQLAEEFYFINPKGIKSDPSKIVSRIYRVQNYLISNPGRPNQMYYLSFEQAKESLEKVIDKVNLYFEKDWKKLIEIINSSKLTIIEEIPLIKNKP